MSINNEVNEIYNNLKLEASRTTTEISQEISYGTYCEFIINSR